MARSPVLLLALLGACKEPVAGECLGRPGSLCLTVRNAEGFPARLRAVLEVRVGACDALPPFPCQGGRPVARPRGCKLSCQDLEAPGRFTGAEGRFTAEVDLSDSPGPGQAAVRLYAGGDPEGCVGQAQVPFEAPGPLALDPRAAACPVRPRRCTSHVDCGGPAAAQLCDRGLCVEPAADLCPPGMVLIPAGSLVLGSEAGLPFEKPCPPDMGLQRFRIVRPFCLDRTEATVAQYRQCALCGPPQLSDDTRCTFRWSGNDALAVNCLTHGEAVAYCEAREWRGSKGRLPWEAEWEWAAGRDAPKLRFPWGDTTPTNLCEYANGSGCEAAMPRVRAPGQTPLGDSPAQPAVAWPSAPLLDLAGNVAEWTGDRTRSTDGHSYCELKDADAPWNSAVGDWRIVRGGHYEDQAFTLRTFSRNRLPPAPDPMLRPHVGVRCALDPVLPTP